MTDRIDAPGAVPVSAEARAKVNLFLAVGARRPDGFHEVTTVLQAIELADSIEVRPGRRGTTVEHDVDLGIPMQDDLVYRAAEAWRALHGFDGGIGIRVTKRIPSGAGLGGGSSDAAAVLAALGTWSRSGTADRRTLAAAARLGADVPFFLGDGTQVMSGRGDESVRSLRTPRLHLAIVSPGVAAPTGAVYAQFDRALIPAPPGPGEMVRAIEDDVARGIAVRLYNNMTEAACALVPEIRGALRFLEEADGVLGSAMAGSGSAAFGVFETARSAQAAAAAAVERGWWSCATASAPQGVLLRTLEGE
jgi:4-diphosphocytidyl-2-C-methyl-D-erythritol kinase